jgi:hypothetical protein
MSFLKSIPEPKMPTLEQHRATSLKWLKWNQPTLIDHWPADLAALSMPTKLVQVPDGLYEEFCDLHDGKVPGPIMNAFAPVLDAEFGWDRKFIRLNSRSPKDLPWPFESPMTLSGKEALSILSCSMRVLDDLQEFSYLPEQPAYVCLRDIVYGMTPSKEFRCFVKAGDLIAVTHYDYQKPIKPPEDGGRDLRTRIEAWFKDVLKPTLHLETVVFDIFVRHDGSFLLIEINPYGSSDTCFFGGYANMEKASSFVQFEFPEDFHDQN